MNRTLRRAVPTALLASGLVLTGGGVAAGQLPPLDDLADLGGLEIGDLANAGDLGLRDLAGDGLGVDQLDQGLGGLGDDGVGVSGDDLGLGVDDIGSGLDAVCNSPLAALGLLDGLCDDGPSGAGSVVGLSDPADDANWDKAPERPTDDRDKPDKHGVRHKPDMPKMPDKGHLRLPERKPMDKVDDVDKVVKDHTRMIDRKPDLPRVDKRLPYTKLLRPW